MTPFLTALALGLLFNAAPGAVFAETVKVGPRGGFIAFLPLARFSLRNTLTRRLPSMPNRRAARA